MHTLPPDGLESGDTSQARSRSRDGAKRVTASVAATVLALPLAAGAVVAPPMQHR